MAGSWWSSQSSWEGDLTRILATFVATLLLFCTASGQVPDVAAGAQDADSDSWSFAAEIAGYLVPHDQSYASPSFSADRRRLHLEARYNYENLQTGSVWAGWNFSVGDRLVLDATPMLGAVFGNTTGVAPGYEMSLSYKKLELYSQGEYVIDTRDHEESFFYAWNELVYSPVDWFHAGLVAQRTRVYSTGLDVQRGFSAGLAYRKLDFTTYVFNLGWTEPTVVLIMGVRF